MEKTFAVIQEALFWYHRGKLGKEDVVARITDEIEMAKKRGLITEVKEVKDYVPSTMMSKKQEPKKRGPKKGRARVFSDAAMKIIDEEIAKDQGRGLSNRIVARVKKELKEKYNWSSFTKTISKIKQEKGTGDKALPSASKIETSDVF